MSEVGDEPTPVTYFAACGECLHGQTPTNPAPIFTSVENRQAYIVAHQTETGHGQFVVGEFYDGGEVDLGLFRGGGPITDRDFRMTMEEWPT